ncbi:hypothetical protein D3C72_1776830 [compost metagenome]
MMDKQQVIAHLLHQSGCGRALDADRFDGGACLGQGQTQASMGPRDQRIAPALRAQRLGECLGLSLAAIFGAEVISGKGGAEPPHTAAHRRVRVIVCHRRVNGG